MSNELIENAVCPFCGSDGEANERHNPMSKWRWSVDCAGTTCGMSGPVEATKADAWAAWNKRHRTAGQAELTREEAAHEITIDQRDIAERWADELARLIGQMTGVEIGEHSNLNFPWQNAAEAARAALSTTPDLSRDEGRAL